MKYVLEIISFLVIVICVVLVNMQHVVPVLDEQLNTDNITVFDDIIDSESEIIYDNGSLSLINDKMNYVTSNGKDLLLGKVLNPTNETLLTFVKVAGQEFEALILPYDEWVYAVSGQFIMAPSKSGVGISNMAFYEQGNQLVAVVNFSESSSVSIYVGDMGGPSRVYVDSSYTSWSYDKRAKIVNIESTFGSLHKIVLDWNNYFRMPHGPVFIEDTIRKENKIFELSQLKERAIGVTEVFDGFNSTAYDLSLILETKSSQLNQTGGLNSEMAENITSTNSSIVSMTESIEGMVILSPLKTALTVLIVIAVVLFSVYSVFLKGDKNED